MIILKCLLFLAAVHAQDFQNFFVDPIEGHDRRRDRNIGNPSTFTFSPPIHSSINIMEC